MTPCRIAIDQAKLYYPASLNDVSGNSACPRIPHQPSIPTLCARPEHAQSVRVSSPPDR